MSSDVKLNDNGDPDFTSGESTIIGVDELRQSLRLRLMSSTGWAKNDDDFGVEWITFFGTDDDNEIVAAKIAEAYEKDDRVSEVLKVDIKNHLDKRSVNVIVKLRLADTGLTTDTNDPNIIIRQPIEI